MDKYEYKLKVEQLERLLQEKDYETAAGIADTINWRKVKSAATLCMVGEIYDRSKRYEDSREILLMAYDRAAVGRNVLYRLTLVALKMGNLEEAKDYFEEFLDVAPKDNSKYVLRYQIAKMDGEPLREQIEILEEFKERDFREEWAFELAYLYHKAGDGARCAAVCDELELWYGDGEYVEKALEMKMLHQPLNPRQEEKYRQFCRQRRGRGKSQAKGKERADADGGSPDGLPDITPSPSKFNTSNLQAELSKGMQQIMNASTQEKVTDTMDNIKRMVKDIPYLQMPPSGRAEEAEGQFGHIETEEEIDRSLNSQFNQYLAEEWDGQYRMHVPAGAAYEPQVAGQMNIDDVLSEWERTQRAYEAVMENAKQRKLESAKARAWQEAQELMSRLNSILPELEAGVSTQELMEKQYLQEGEAKLYSEGQDAPEGYYAKEPMMQSGYDSEESMVQDGYYTEESVGQAGYYTEEPAVQDGYSIEESAGHSGYYGEETAGDYFGGAPIENPGYRQEGYYSDEPEGHSVYQSEGCDMGEPAIQNGYYPEDVAEQYGYGTESSAIQDTYNPEEPMDQQSNYDEELTEQSDGYGEEPTEQSECLERLEGEEGDSLRGTAEQESECLEEPEDDLGHASHCAEEHAEKAAFPEDAGEQSVDAEEPDRQVIAGQDGCPEGNQEESEYLHKAFGKNECRDEDRMQRAGFRIQESDIQSSDTQKMQAQEAYGQEPAAQEASIQLMDAQEPVMQELGKQEPVMQELGKQEPAMQELGKQEPAMQEPSKQEPAMQEPSTQEAQAQESNAQELDSQEAAPQAPQEPAEEGLQAQDSEEGSDPIAILRKASPDQLPATSASQDGHFVRRPPQASEDSFRRRQDRPFGTPYPSSSRAPRDFQRGSSIIPLEKLIEKQAEQEINRQEEKEDGNKDAEQCLESAFRAARASREEKHTVPKMDLEEESKKPRLSEEQREIFSYFVPVQGMEEQLCQVLEDVAQHKEGSLTSSGGNIVIMGGKGSGKTVLATDFIKAIQKAGVQPGGKVGKITGDSLNQKDLSQLLKKVVGGYLIIERAGEMTHETVTRLALLMDRDTNGLLVILEDTRTEIEKVLSLDVNFAKKFTERIKIPVFTSDELVEFAKAYAAEQECEIDDMGVLALYNRISSIQKLDEPTTLTEVKEIMDEAIYCAERGGLKKLFGGKKFSPEGYLYLRERDFN